MGKLKGERTGPISSSLVLVGLVTERHALVREACLRPAQREAVELFKAAAPEAVADDRHARGVCARDLAEPGEGEAHVSVRLERGVFSCRVGEPRAGRRRLVVRARRRYNSPSDVVVCGEVWRLVGEGKGKGHANGRCFAR